MAAQRTEVGRASTHPAAETTDHEGLGRLSTTGAVLARYDRPGPHATVVLPIPVPGRARNDLDKRWHATKANLRHLGATDRVLQHVEDAVGALAQCGFDALITADEHDAAYCWLTNSDSDIDVGEMIHVGPHPTLAPAIAEIDRRPSVVCAAVDRVGADVFVVDHAHIEHVNSTDGERDGIHKSAGDGADQARNQRHSEVIWDRNADLVAAAIADRITRGAATPVTLTGDGRAIELVTRHLAAAGIRNVQHVSAGGRHESATRRRLLEAAMTVAANAQSNAIEHDLERLREELGQRDLAVDGDVHTREAIADARVATLFVDSGRWREHPHLDETIHAAGAQGGSVVVAPAPDIADGLAALIRRPYLDAVDR